MTDPTIGKLMYLHTKESPDVRQRRLKEACREFEAIFLEYMLKTMRKSVPKADLFKRGQAEEIYTFLLDEQLAKKIAHTKGIGLANLLFEEFKR